MSAVYLSRLVFPTHFLSSHTASRLYLLTFFFNFFYFSFLTFSFFLHLTFLLRCHIFFPLVSSFSILFIFLSFPNTFPSHPLSFFCLLLFSSLLFLPSFLLPFSSLFFSLLSYSFIRPSFLIFSLSSLSLSPQTSKSTELASVNMFRKKIPDIFFSFFTYDCSFPF